MLEILKRIVWDLQDPIGRFDFYSFLLRNAPGRLGEILRAAVVSRYAASVGRGLRVGRGVRFRTVHRIVIGDDVRLGDRCFLQGGGGVTIGRDVELAEDVKIWSVNHAIESVETAIKKQGFVEDEVVVGDGCRIGAGVFIFPGVRLPEGCLVEDHSVVGKKIYPPHAVVAGYPARVRGKRDAGSRGPKGGLSGPETPSVP